MYSLAILFYTIAEISGYAVAFKSFSLLCRRGAEFSADIIK